MTMWRTSLSRRLDKHQCMKGPGDPYAWFHGIATVEAKCFPHIPVFFEQATLVLESFKGGKVTRYKIGHEFSILTREDDVTKWDTVTLHYLGDGYGVHVYHFHSLIDNVKGTTRSLRIVNHFVLPKLSIGWDVLTSYMHC